MEEATVEQTGREAQTNSKTALRVPTVRQQITLKTFAVIIAKEKLRVV